MMKMIHIILSFLALLLSSYTSNAASYASSSDFCVADLNLPNTPSGYPCKSETKVTVNDFVSSGFDVPANTEEGPFNFGIKTAFVKDLPGLNGLGISVLRGDVGINGTVPMHIHPDATELLIVVKGQVIAGFITPTKLIVKTLNPGDVMVFPKGLMQFAVNSGVGKATGYAFYSSSNPSVQLVDVLLFGNSLSTAIVSKTTLLEPEQVKKLKAVFGGSG